MIDAGVGVELKPLTELSAAQALLWRNDPKIYHWCRQYEPLSREKHYSWVSSLSSREDVKMFSIWKTNTYVNPVGVCGLTSIDLINRHAEFSLYIGPEYWGNGLGSAALKTLISFGFNSMGLNHIFGETFEGNPAAKMFESIGFTCDGKRRKYYYRNGEFIDCYLYSILKDEYHP